MNKTFFARFAFSNLLRNKRLNAPYFIALSLMSAMFFTIVNTYIARTVSRVNYDSAFGAMILIGTFVMGIFTLFYVFYLNGFLISQRKKEFGLYSVLGMEKKHICALIALESLFINMSAVIIGMLFGSVFGRLMFMLLSALTQTQNGQYSLSLASYIFTICYFAGVVVICMVYNQIKVLLSSPLALLSAKQKGEKKLRFVLPFTLLGIVLLFTAYGFSIFVDSVGLSVTFFWPCVVLVIIATFILFAQASQFVLRKLKTNERFYYAPRHFVSVSALSFRFRRNAASMANICILSTMVLVTVSACCALYFGQETILKTQNPNDFVFSALVEDSQSKQAKQVIAKKLESLAQEKNVNIAKSFSYSFLSGRCVLYKGKFYFTDKQGNPTYPSESAFYLSSSTYEIRIITEQEYQMVTGQSLGLNPDEVTVLSSAEVNPDENAPKLVEDFTLKNVISESAFTKGKNSSERIKLFFVTADKASAAKLQKAINNELSEETYMLSCPVYTACVTNLNGDKQARADFGSNAAQEISKSLETEGIQIPDGYSYSSIDESRIESYNTFGGLMFLGMYFSVLFLMNTVVIIYFKQVSEGYDDRGRFEVLQKVGMSDQEVKKTISSQVRVVFFLPLIASIIHIIAASNIITKMLSAFVMTNTTLVMICIGVSALAFTIVYVCVFKITAKVYYEIVRR